MMVVSAMALVIRRLARRFYLQALGRFDHKKYVSEMTKSEGTTSGREIVEVEPSECLAFVTTLPITAFETQGFYQSRDAHGWHSSPSDVRSRVSARGAR